MEPKRTNKEVILQAVEELPEEQLAKVVSLLDKLHEEEKKKKTEAYRKAIDRAWGFLEGSPSGTEEFMKRKQEEKKLDR